MSDEVKKPSIVECTLVGALYVGCSLFAYYWAGNYLAILIAWDGASLRTAVLTCA